MGLYYYLCCTYMPAYKCKWNTNINIIRMRLSVREFVNIIFRKMLMVITNNAYLNQEIYFFIFF